MARKSILVVKLVFFLIQQDKESQNFNSLRPDSLQPCSSVGVRAGAISKEESQDCMRYVTSFSVERVSSERFKKPVFPAEFGMLPRKRSHCYDSND
jgi:hypothetical protein